MKREPVETMGRMALMQELHEWRTIGPALKAVARAAEEVTMGMWHEEEDTTWLLAKFATPHVDALFSALARLERVSRRREGT